LLGTTRYLFLFEKYAFGCSRNWSEKISGHKVEPRQAFVLWGAVSGAVLLVAQYTLQAS
jgi:hypothetical protein